ASGALVGPNDVLTAAHVLHEAGLTLTGIDILPAFHVADGADGLFHPETDGQTPFGRYSTDNINDVHIHSFSSSTAGELTDAESASDIALITLPVNLGNEVGSWFGMRANAPEGDYHALGYPLWSNERFVSTSSDDGWTSFTEAGNFNAA